MKIGVKTKNIFSAITLSKKAFGKYKRQIIVLTILGFLSGILEGIGINALIPLFSFVMGEGQGGNDFLSKAIEGIFQYFGVGFNVRYLLILICSLFIFKALVLVYFSYIGIKIAADYEEKTRSGLFKRTLDANWPYLLKQKLGHLETILMINVQRSSGMLRSISTIIMAFTSLLVYTAVAFNISVNITLITLGFGFLLFFVFQPLANRIKIFASETTEMNKDVAHYVNENMLGMKSVKAMFVSNKIQERANNLFNYLRKLKVKVFLLTNIAGTIFQPLSLVLVCIIFALSYKSPDFSFAVLVAVVYLIQRIFTYLRQLQTQLYGINAVTPYLKNILDYEEASSEKEETCGEGKPFLFSNLLSFENVGFSYDSGSRVLERINFSIHRGEMVGLIGPSGAGKTTVVDLILRLFVPSDGRILLDGKDAGQISLKEWRKSIGYVSQDIFLMNDTIANNIRFYDDQITDRDIEEAARMANIYDFIQDLPEKFSTILGERGIRLSVGQRQRIVLARILARKPKILVLDEATSALDNESEIKIQKVIENLKGRVTVLVIAHRLSTVLDSDNLLVLEGGKIIEQGRPGELLKDKDSYFYKMYNIRNGV